MKRMEIILNHSIEEDLLELLSRKNVAAKYTRYPEVHGAGHSEPKQGNSVWPEENVVDVIYCGEEEAAGIRETVRELKSYFPKEGVKGFETNAEQTV